MSEKDRNARKHALMQRVRNLIVPVTGFLIGGMFAGGAFLLALPFLPRPPVQQPLVFDVIDRQPAQILSAGKSWTHVFTIRNPTKRPVTISKVECGCECNDHKLAMAHLAPGESTTLEVSERVGTSVGQKVIDCALITDCPEQARWRCLAETETYPPARFVPNQLHLGVVPIHGKASREIVFESYAPIGVEPIAFAPVTSGGVTLRPVGPSAKTGVSGGIVRFTTPLLAELSAGTSPGPNQVTLRNLTAPDDGELPTLLASWQLRPAIALEPSSGAFFGTVAPTDGRKMRTIVLSCSEQPFRILGIKVARNDLVSVTHSAECLRLHRLEVRLDCNSVHGPLVGDLVVKVDHPRQPEIRIAFAAFGKEGG